MKRRLILAGILVLSGVAICWRASAQTQSEMNRDAQADAEKADEALNRTYKKLMELSTDQKDKDRLKAAERAWIQYRDAQTAYEAGFYEGGSIQPLIRASAESRLTRARTTQLKEHIVDLQH